jgi:hypothetical protein
MLKIKLAMQQFFGKYYSTIKCHFDLVHKGKEDLAIVLWVWGGGAYLLSFFINKLVLFINLLFIKWIISILVIAYFVWHIIIIRRCAPKKPPLSAEEKEKLKKDRVKRFMRKLFLREPFTKWDPAIVGIAINFYVIVHFLEYLLK